MPAPKRQTSSVDLVTWRQCLNARAQISRGRDVPAIDAEDDVAGAPAALPDRTFGSGVLQEHAVGAQQAEGFCHGLIDRARL